MSEKDDEFIKLQQIWYEKLKASGFEDQENAAGYMKDWPSVRLRRQYTPEAFKEKQDYYRIASQLLHEDIFKNDLEKQIWERHTEGITMREIATELRAEYPTINKDSVHGVISKLSKIVYTRILNEEE